MMLTFFARKSEWKAPALLGPKALALAGILSSLASPAFALDQTTAQEEAKRVHDKGSDDSLKESYKNGMHAFDNFINLNLPGAVTYGLKAYGQYKNSDQLEDLRDKNKKLENVMTTTGSQTATGQDNSTVTGSGGQWKSPYARLDRKFLYEGDAGKIAGKFEKLTGIERDKLFQMVVNTHEKSKSISDPGFAEWGLKAWKDAVHWLPEGDYKNTLSKVTARAEEGINSGIAKRVIAQFQNTKPLEAPSTMVAGEPSATSGSEPTPEPAAEIAAEAPAAEVAVAAQPQEEAAPSDGSGLGDTVAFTNRGIAAVYKQNRGYDGIQTDPMDKFLAGLVHASNGEVNIFRTVSRKIREMNEKQHLESQVVGGMQMAQSDYSPAPH